MRALRGCWREAITALIFLSLLDGRASRSSVLPTVTGLLLVAFSELLLLLAMCQAQPRRIALFGGTFNPVHAGHLALAEDAVASLQLHRCYLIPNKMPPHKQGVLPARHRLAMLKLAVIVKPHLRISDCELRRDAVSYTADTVAEFRRQYPNDRLMLIIGADSFNTLHKWHRWQDIVHHAQLVVYPRPGYALANAVVMAYLREHQLVEPLLQDHVPMAVSSTRLRHELLDDSLHDVSDMPASVVKYIRRHRLYAAVPSAPGATAKP